MWISLIIFLFVVLDFITSRKREKEPFFAPSTSSMFSTQFKVLWVFFHKFTFCQLSQFFPGGPFWPVGGGVWGGGPLVAFTPSLGVWDEIST